MPAKYTLEEGFNIANVECVKIVTRENTPAAHVYKTMTKFTAEAYVDEGQEVVQRVKNNIMGRIKTDDILSGYNISCEDERFIPKVIALLDGGKWETGSGSSNSKYTGPKAGEATERTAFDLYLYTSDRGAGGEVKNILEWKFPNGKGKPVKFGGEDNAFSKQAYEIQTRPETGEETYSVSIVDKFPYDETTD